MKTVSLELAKQLHEASKGELVRPERGYQIDPENDKTLPFMIKGVDYPAYTADELLELLPATITTKEKNYTFKMNRVSNDGLFFVCYEKFDGWEGLHSDESPAEALGKLLLYLLQNDLYKPNES